MCDSQDLTLQAILSNGVATVRQTLSRVFSAMAAEWANRRRKLVLWPAYIIYHYVLYTGAFRFRCPLKERHYLSERIYWGKFIRRTRA